MLCLNVCLIVCPALFRVVETRKCCYMGCYICERGKSRREDLNLGRRFFSSTGRRICGGVERERCNFCPFLSNAVDGGRVVLLPVLLSFYGGFLVE